MNQLRPIAYLLMFICVTLLTAVPTTHAQQPDSTTHEFTFSEMGFRADRQALGIVSKLTYDLPIPRSWEPIEPTINLHFSHSTLLLPEFSQITVYYNDMPLTDVRLTEENAQNSWLEIQLPSSALKSGKHRLKLIFSQHLSEDECSNEESSPALWTTIHSDSTITFDTEQAAGLDLAWFPEPFSIYGRQAVQPVELTVVLPEQPDEAELRAAGVALAKLGQIAGVRQLDLSVSLGKMPKAGHAFVIAGTDRADELLKKEKSLSLDLTSKGFMTPDSTIVPVDDGVIQLTKRADGSGLLLLSGQSELGLTRAALALADHNSLKLMSGQFTLVKETPQSVHAPQSLSESMTLEELSGMGNQRIKGITIEEAQYCFRLPHNWNVGPNAMLDLNYAHSPILWAERSSLEVRLNGATVSSAKLDPAEGGQKQAQISLPADEFIDGYNCLQFVFTLRLEPNQCVLDLGHEAWAEIDATSQLFLPHSQAEENDWLPNMAQYPYPFNLDTDLANTTLVLPESPNEQELLGALKVAARLGHEARHQTLQLQLKTAKAWDEQSDKNNHLILIGDGKRNVASTQLAEELLSFTGSNETTMKVRQDMVLHQQSGTSLASAELLHSPWATDRAILQLSSYNESALEQLFELLSSNRAEESLNGNIVIVTEAGMVRGLDTLNRTAGAGDIEVNVQGLFREDPQNSATIRWFLIGGMTLLGGILLTAFSLAIREKQRQPNQAAFGHSTEIKPAIVVGGSTSTSKLPRKNGLVP
ncbi:MAG: cellulose biosynthesis cyclic di-GMP-binding regulatory protein BcsB [Ardenticatenaceae bacterium]